MPFHSISALRGTTDRSPRDQGYKGHRTVRVQRGNMRFGEAILDFLAGMYIRIYQKTTKYIRIQFMVLWATCFAHILYSKQDDCMKTQLSGFCFVNSLNAGHNTKLNPSKKKQKNYPLKLRLSIVQIEVELGKNRINFSKKVILLK